MSERKPKLGTLSVWAGEENRDGWQCATQVPVVHSVSYGYDDLTPGTTWRWERKRDILIADLESALKAI